MARTAPDRSLKRQGCLAAGIAALAVLIQGTGAPAQTQPPATRTEVPIREVRLSDGVRRYGVPLTIGSTPVLAGLDTGAAGLRIMPDAIPSGAAKAGVQSEYYNFGSGTRLDGVVGQVGIKLSDRSVPSSAHLVTKVGCVASAPRCPGTLGLGYGFLGDGLPNEGFRVLLGANMGPTTIDNPLIAAGARRWIIELPRPGETAPGRLVINPTDEEVAGFVMLRLVGGFREEEGGGLHDSVLACLSNENIRARICGPTALDTGAYSVRVLNSAQDPSSWPGGAPMALEFTDETRKAGVVVRMTVGREAQSVLFGSAPRRETIIEAGVAPYFAYSVLYDPVRRMMGFKARPPFEGGPQGDAPPH